MVNLRTQMGTRSNPRFRSESDPNKGVPTMKVYAASDDIKKYIKHPFGVTQFDADGLAEWPDDQFTRRRLRDGDITLEPAPSGRHRKAIEPPTSV